MTFRDNIRTIKEDKITDQISGRILDLVCLYFRHKFLNMKKLRLFFLFVLCYNFSFAQSIIYVDTNGNDLNPGTLNLPKEHIQAAIDASQNGDTIMVNPGRYVENIQVLNKELFFLTQFHYSGDTNDINNTIIDGDSAGRAFFANNFDGLIEGFTIEKGYLVGQGPCLYIGSVTNVTVRFCNLQKSKADGDQTFAGLYLGSEGFAMIENCNVRWNYGRKSTVYLRPWTSSSRIIFRNSKIYSNIAWEETNVDIMSGNLSLYNLQIYNNTGGGLKVFKNPFVTQNELFISNLTIRNNSLFGLWIWSTSPSSTTQTHDVNIINSIIHGNSPHNIRLKTDNPQIPANLFVRNCLVQNGSGSVLFQTSGCNLNYDASNIEDDPQLLYNNTLSSTSPALGAGINNITIGGQSQYIHPFDFFGNARPMPQFSNSDIGAIESPLGNPLCSPIFDTIQVVSCSPYTTPSGNQTLNSSGIYYDTIAGQLCDSIIVIEFSIDSRSIYYVSNSGHNSNIGSISNPLKTIQHAIDLICNDGDTIVVLNGTYKENLQISGKDIMLTSMYLFTNDTTDISNTIVDGDSSGRVLQCTDFNGQIIGITFEKGESTYGAGIYIHSSLNPSIRNCISQYNNGTGDICGAGLAFHTQYGTAENLTIRFNYGRKHTVDISGGSIFRNSRISNNIAWEESNVVIQNGSPELYNLFIHDNIGGGLKIWPNAPSAKISNLTITRNDLFGLLVWGLNTTQNTTGRIINSIVWGNYDDEIKLKQSSFSGAETQLYIDYSLVPMIIENLTLDTFCSVSSGNNMIIGDPFFIDPESDFRISDSSICIGSGIDTTLIGSLSVYAPFNDFYGNQRPNPTGSRPDIGAFESSLAAPLYPLSIKNSSDFNMDIDLYPNPSYGLVELRLNGTDLTRGVYSLISLDGRIILSNNFKFDNVQDVIVIDFRGVSAGSYSLLIQNEFGLLTSKLVIVN